MSSPPHPNFPETSSDLSTPSNFVAGLKAPFLAEPLFDQFEDVTYFVKDHAGRYLSLNKTLVHRCGARHKADLIGRTAAEIYPKRLGPHFLNQDLAVIRTGKPLIDELERHPYPKRSTGWCLTSKWPVCDFDNKPIGVVGMSRDLHQPHDQGEIYTCVAHIIEHVKKNLDQVTKVADLTESEGLSVWQLDQRTKEMFGITTSQLILQIRLEAAANMLLETDAAVIQVATSIGYADQSAFSRQFRKTFGSTPSEYRRDRHAH
jgi:AraC-like DNA-binding protein